MLEKGEGSSRCQPYDLLPLGLKFDNTANERLIYDDSDGSTPGFVDLNLSNTFCQVLTTIMLCPAFKDNLDFLRYARELSHFHRICGTRPIEPQVLDEDGSLALPEHFEFVKYIEDEARSRTQREQRIGIVKRDLSEVHEAWDEYARKISLPSMKEFQKEYRKTLGNPGRTTRFDRDAILRLKKEMNVRS
jgi:hypothetical protein